MRNVLWSRASVCLSVCPRTHSYTIAWTRIELGRVVGDAPLCSVHCWANLQSKHGLPCYGNITRTRNISEYMLVLALCLFPYSIAIRRHTLIRAHTCGTVSLPSSNRCANSNPNHNHNPKPGRNYGPKACS